MLPCRPLLYLAPRLCRLSKQQNPFKLNQCVILSFSAKSGNEGTEPWIPEYKAKQGETIDEKRSRLLYQSRKRGILENGLLLGTFASKYLQSMTEEELALYDRLINLPSNDWDIYYWATGTRPIPEEFDNGVMAKLVEHARNADREARISMPPLQS